VKLLFENWRRYLNEALEYDPANAGVPAQDIPIPPHLKELADEVQRLDVKVQKAYEQGDPSADDLNAEFAEKQHQLETALSELEGEPLIGGEESKYTTMNPSDLMRQMASIYWHYKERVPYQGVVITKEELIEFLRAWAEGYGWQLGGFKEDTTDEQLLDAAKDSYERMQRLKSKRTR